MGQSVDGSAAHTTPPNQCGRWSTSFVLSCRMRCKCDLSVATKWVMPPDCGGARRTVHQSESEASWQRRWRGLSQLHRSAVVWYTEPAFDAAAAAQSIEEVQT